MKKNTWGHVLIKILMVSLVLGVLHKNQWLVSLVKGLDISYLTSFKTLNVDTLVNEQLHLVNTADSASLLVQQVQQDTAVPLEAPVQEEKEEAIEEKDEDEKTHKQSIYIYNTHQYEGYTTHTVMDGARYLANKLEELGYEVVVEENDFEAFKRENNMDLTETYPTSRIFMEKAIETHGPFDLIIDFHRDAINKDASTYIEGDKSYAKMMMVVSLSSINHETVEANSALVHQEVDAIQSGIMRYDFKRENVYYNQQYAPRMLLIEIGGMDNTFEEVQNSLDVLSQALDRCLKGGKLQ